MTVKARHQARSIATLAALFAASGVVPMGAQTASRGQPRADTPRMVVQVFGSADKEAGPEASDALRERLIRAFPSRILWVFPKEEIVGFIEQSGYPPTEQLGKNDEATLAKFLRADEYIRGNVVKQGDVYRVTAQLVLTRDAALTQPLPASEDRRADRAAEGLVKAIQDARKQLDNEKRCRDLATQDKLDEAVAVADAGIAEYPNATLVRYCKINVLVRRKAESAELLKAANEILAIDSVSKVALSIAADAQNAAGNVDAANELLVRLLATDPTNSSLAKQVVDALAASKKYDMAKEIVNKAVADNPGDIGLIRLQFLILASAGDYKPAIQIGEEMVQMDTSLADVDYYTRMAALYSADSQPQKSAEALARGTQKFSNNAELWQMHAAALRQAGQLQQSIASAKRALEVDPKIAGGWLQIANSYNDLEQPDSALAALQQARTAGDNPDQVAQMATAFGNRIYRAAVADSVKTVENFENALPFLQLADTLAVSPDAKADAKLLIGISNYYITQVLVQGLQASKSCEDSRRAETHATAATINVQQGGRRSPEAAGQVLTQVTSYLPYIQQSVKAYCK
jgi:tetratricopeptide (TPR) repeat protein